LLDRDAALLKQKDADITQLTEKLQQLRTDVSGIDIVICV